MEKMKKICFLLSKFSKGGGERVVSILSNELMEFFDVEILLIGSKSYDDYKTKAKVIELNSTLSSNNAMLLFKSIKNLKKYIRENNPLVIISFMELPNLLNLLVNGNHKKIISVRNHMSAKWGYKKNIWNLSIRYLYKNADMIVSPTILIADDLKYTYGIADEKIKVINNPYPIQQIQKNISNKDENVFCIATMGSLVKAKGVYQLLQSYIIFCNEHPELKSKLIFIGKGEEENGLKELADNSGLSENIEFTGFLSNPHEVLSKADLYVLASYYEGFPNAMVEAMICRVPVIATNCPSGPSEILSETNINHIDTIRRCDYGFLMPVFHNNISEKEHDLAKFFYNFSFMSRDEKNNLVSSAEKKMQMFDVSIIVREWLKIIDE